ncbi:MAG: TolC family protein [FCB group bacterium]|nr:TolC family protein [FCB group bacterium]
MSIKKIILISGLILVMVSFIADQTFATNKKRFYIGYFEGGKYLTHDLLRNEFYDQLDAVLPESDTIITIPQGYRSAGWNRDTCRAMAAQLTQVKRLDLIIAIGPWVVEDLIKAGFKKPIIAIHQFDPKAQGLLDSTNHPIVSNLTVQYDPKKIFEDLAFLTRLHRVKRLGVLYFPSGNEKDKIIDNISTMGKQLGFKVVTAEGFNNVGTYAFFKAYKRLDKNIDALYLPPLWGMDIVKIKDFFKLINRRKIPTFTSEGKILIEKGAMATKSYYAAITEARFCAIKTVKIIEGATPADLPVAYESGDGLAVNNKTALECGISLPEDILNDFYVIEAPLPEDAPHYNLNDALNRAINQNPGYLSYYNALEAASQKAKQAYAKLLPRLDGTAAFKYVDNHTITNSYNTLNNEQYYASFNLEQTLFSLETIKSIQVAAKNRELKNINLTQAQLDLELGISLSYLDYLKANEQLKAYLNNRNLIEHNLELARAKNQFEKGDTLDIIRLEDDRYQAVLKVSIAQKNVAVSRIFFNALLNFSGNRLFTLDSETFSTKAFWKNELRVIAQLDTKPKQENEENILLNTALVQNPLMQNYKTKVELQKTLIAQNTARYFPTFGFKSSLNFADRYKDSPTFNKENNTWSLAAFFKIPIFSGTDRIRERGKLKAQLDKIEYQKDNISLKIMKNVQSNFSRLIAYVNNMNPAYQSRKRAYDALDMVVKKYSANKIPLIDLLDVQNNALRTDLNAINTRYNYYKTMARLVHAIGWTAADNYSNFWDVFHKKLR